MKPLRVHLKERSYPICFGSYTTDLPSAMKRLTSSKTKVFVVTSRSLKKAKHSQRLVLNLKNKGFRCSVATLPDGESQKTLNTVRRLYSLGLQAGLDRQSLVLALGGGVLTDMAGFFAATYMRGLSFVSVPTTLLGMVDAAIGGKTGVDLPEGKNLVGAFWQPRLVWIDSLVLKTLPEREWRTGFAEIIKYGVIKSRAFFEWCEDQIRRNPSVWLWNERDIQRAIFTSAQIKAQVVSGDERERPLKGGREILNFGHTLGHALEAAMGYKSFSHGEAISVGMVGAGHLARLLGLWSDDEQLQLSLLLQTTGLPIHFPKLTAFQRKRFWSALEKDKKNISGQLRFVLPKRIGLVEARSGIPKSLVAQTVRDLEVF